MDGDGTMDLLIDRNVFQRAGKKRELLVYKLDEKGTHLSDATKAFGTRIADFVKVTKASPSTPSMRQGPGGAWNVDPFE